MANDSVSSMAKQLEMQVSRILRGVNERNIELRQRNLLANLRQSLADARIYSHDYELSEMREERLKNAAKAKKWLEAARQQILKASESNIFGPVDVAHLSARIDIMKSGLK